MIWWPAGGFRNTQAGLLCHWLFPCVQVPSSPSASFESDSKQSHHLNHIWNPYLVVQSEANYHNQLICCHRHHLSCPSHHDHHPDQIPRWVCSGKLEDKQRLWGAGRRFHLWHSFYSQGGLHHHLHLYHHHHCQCHHTSCTRWYLKVKKWEK